LTYQNLLEGMSLLKVKNKYCCEEHVDLAFDDFLVENEVFPVMIESNEGSCNYCKCKARYALIVSEENK
jgi:CxxH/CxxC protein (TIGR04129 family)